MHEYSDTHVIAGEDDAQWSLIIVHHVHAGSYGCAAVRCGAVWYGIVWLLWLCRGAVRCGVVWYSMAPMVVPRCGAVRCGMV